MKLRLGAEILGTKVVGEWENYGLTHLNMIWRLLSMYEDWNNGTKMFCQVCILLFIDYSGILFYPKIPLHHLVYDPRLP